MITRDKLLGFMKSDLGVGTDSLTDDTPLFSSGLIDSFSLVMLMSFLESEGKFRINPVDVSLENMDSVERILNFSKRMRP